MRGDLQVLFGFRNEEVQDLSWNFIIVRQIVREIIFRQVCGAPCAKHGVGSLFFHFSGFGGGRPSECKCIAMFESGNVIDGFFPVRADLQEIKFKNGDGIRQEFSERAVRVRTQLRIARILKNMRQSAGDFREQRISPAARGFGQLMRSVVKANEIIPGGLGLDR